MPLRSKNNNSPGARSDSSVVSDIAEDPKIQKVSNVRSRRCFPSGDDLPNDKVSEECENFEVYSRKMVLYKKKKEKVLAGVPLLMSLVSSEDDLSNDSDDLQWNPKNVTVETVVPPAVTERGDENNLDENRDGPRRLRTLRPRKQPRETINKKTKSLFNTLDKLMSQYQENSTVNLGDSFSLEDAGIQMASPPSPNEKILIRIKWKTQILNFHFKLSEKFADILPEIARSLEMPADKLQLMRKEEFLSLNDTLASVNCQIGDIIECFSTIDDKPMETGQEAIDPNTIEIKVQSNSDKRKTSLRCHKLEPLMKVLENYAALKNLNPDKLQLRFDGDVVDLNDTPHDLDIEDGDCLDIILTK